MYITYIEEKTLHCELWQYTSQNEINVIDFFFIPCTDMSSKKSSYQELGTFFCYFTTECVKTRRCIPFICGAGKVVTFPLIPHPRFLSLQPLCIGGNNGLPIIKKPKRERQKQHQLCRKLLLPATFLIIIIRREDVREFKIGVTYKEGQKSKGQKSKG